MEKVQVNGPEGYNSVQRTHSWHEVKHVSDRIQALQRKKPFEIWVLNKRVLISASAVSHCGDHRHKLRQRSTSKTSRCKKSDLYHWSCF